MLICLITAGVILTPRLVSTDELLTREVVPADLDRAQISLDLVSPSGALDEQPPAVTFERTEPEEYLVEDGDTLSDIAGRYGLDFETVARFNDILNADQLGVGQRLLIPPAPTDLPKSQ
jgi:LysM repeat protein